MLQRLFRTLVIFGLVLAAAVATQAQGDEKVAIQRDGKDSATIRMVMQKAMRSGLCGKVANGTADAKEKAELIVLFTMLSGCEPPKGNAKDWKERTADLLAAAVSGDGANIRKAANCAGCHKLHK